LGCIATLKVRFKSRFNSYSAMECTGRRARRRIKFIGYLKPTGRRAKYVRVERWE